MICPNCFGRGTVPVVLIKSDDGTFRVTQQMPCPECEGQGIVSCCDSGGAGIAEGGEAEKE